LYAEECSNPLQFNWRNVTADNDGDPIDDRERECGVSRKTPFYQSGIFYQLRPIAAARSRSRLRLGLIFLSHDEEGAVESLAV